KNDFVNKEDRVKFYQKRMSLGTTVC
ncbi:hypothetical protein LCGC14_2329380, partial [marine sediment metagenome]